MQIAVIQDGGVDWSYSQGTDPFGNTFTNDTQLDIASATKSFTSALVWQAIDAGLIDPDAPLAPLSAVPSFAYAGQITVRELLAHRTGLTNYRDTPQYTGAAAANLVVTPEQAVTWSGLAPLAFPPGSQAGYSSVNYLVLGFVLEDATHQSFDDLLAKLLTDAGLSDAQILPSEIGLPEFSTAGLQISAHQLAQWGIQLLDRNVAMLSPTALSTLTTPDANGLSAGEEAYCPCQTVGGGTTFDSYGYQGSVSAFQYEPSSKVSAAIQVGDSLWDPADRDQAVLDLLQRLREILLAG